MLHSINRGITRKRLYLVQFRCSSSSEYFWPVINTQAKNPQKEGQPYKNLYTNIQCIIQNANRGKQPNSLQTEKQDKQNGPGL